MRQFLKKMFKNDRSKSAGKTRKCKPSIETLEAREVLSATAVLDFTGGTITEEQQTEGTIAVAHLREGGWDSANQPVVSRPFADLFRGNLGFLDMNDDGRVNSVDADIAIDRIVEKVEQHYSPYKLNIIVGEQHVYQSLLTDNQPGDVIVMVNGDLQRDLTIPQVQNSDGFLGIAPAIDLENDDDEIVFVMGKEIAVTFTDADQFVSNVARVISHEMGHAFGLGHVDSPATGSNAEALSHHMMAAPTKPGNQETRDFNHNAVFQDLDYSAVMVEFPDGSTVRDTQNAHRYLIETLGASAGPWAAALKPGELTIQTVDTPTTSHNDVNVTFNANTGNWQVDFAYAIRTPEGYLFKNASAQFDTNNPDIDSINPYADPIRVIVNGSQAPDKIVFDTTFDADVIAFGNGARDEIRTGSGDDILDGGRDGHADILFSGNGDDTFVVQEQETLLDAGTTVSSLPSTASTTGIPYHNRVSRDFDGDGKTDMAVYRPDTGYWYVLTSGSNFSEAIRRQWGQAGDIALQDSDFDGDGRTDMAVWRPSNGTWYVLTSSSGFNNAIRKQWGRDGDIVLQDSDFDGDGRTDMAVWRPSNGYWYVLTSSSNFSSAIRKQWGRSGDVVIHDSDFDGDGKSDMAVWRPSNGYWYVLTSSSDFKSAIRKQWGRSGDIPVQNSDFDGDGKSDMALWRPSNGTWYVLTSSSNFSSAIRKQWGRSGDITIAGSDFDGDGAADMALYRPSNGYWYVLTSGSNFSNAIRQQWGTNGDIPMQNSDFDGDGRADMTVWRPSNGYWYIRTSSSDYSGAIRKQWGRSGDLPLQNTDYYWASYVSALLNYQLSQAER